jgi:hypothetical protein
MDAMPCELDTDTQRCSKCAAKQRKLAAAYKLKNGDRLRWQARERTRRGRERVLRERVLAKYGGKCQCPGCGISQYEWLAIDHVNGGGCKELREKKFVNSQTFYNYLDKHRKLAKYQILCHNCNSADATGGSVSNLISRRTELIRSWGVQDLWYFKPKTSLI